MNRKRTILVDLERLGTGHHRDGRGSGIRRSEGSGEGPRAASQGTLPAAVLAAGRRPSDREPSSPISEPHATSSPFDFSLLLAEEWKELETETLTLAQHFSDFSLLGAIDGCQHPGASIVELNGENTVFVDTLVGLYRAEHCTLDNRSPSVAHRWPVNEFGSCSIIVINNEGFQIGRVDCGPDPEVAQPLPVSVKALRYFMDLKNIFRPRWAPTSFARHVWLKRVRCHV